jgi:ABC-type branched-subunit amino acid transport system substrate-binding protein
VLGPLFSASVSAATGVLRPSGTTIIAYSTDSSVASRGVYLASYLPQSIIDRTIGHAVAAGHRAFVAFLPAGAIGNVAETQLRKTLTASGAELIEVARYEYTDGSVEAAIEQVAAFIPQADAIFIPDGGNTPGAIVSTLKRRGIALDGKRLLGTGQWASADLKNPNLAGAWLADADQESIMAFRTKYTARFGETPSAIAPVAYDTVALVSGIIKRQGAQGLSTEALESRTGFSGYTGIFRFLPDGTNERGLAVYEVTNGELKLVSPAPRTFRAGS